MKNRADKIPLPQPTSLSAPHWQGCKEGVLKAQQCNDCGQYTFIPRHLCSHCQSRDWQWVACSGKGTLYSYTIVHRAPRPQFTTPYVVVIIELEEGWHILSNLIDCEFDDINLGMAVIVDFKAYTDEITLPLFKPLL